ncbi:MAG TPA: hypothetical protein VFX76_14240 [Roseiflexaceae bacterium]|nr:hypothetical protein [Roseiflexaceae bacterium]
MRYRLFALLLALALLSGCEVFGVSLAPTPSPTAAPTKPPATSIPPPKAPPTTAPEPTAAPAVAPTSAPDPTQSGETVDAKTEAEIEQIEDDTANLRGLQPKENVPETFISPEQLRANLKEQLDKDYSPEEGRRDTLELWLLRLIDDRSIDLYQLQLDLLSEQVLGYYDPKTNEFFVLGSQTELTPLARETIAHEFVHSLQDQHYDLEKMRPDNLDDDRSRAISALIEGDATVSGLQYAQQHMSPTELATLLRESGAASTATLDRAPAYIRESLIFPYQAGAQFIVALARSGGYAAVDTALADPPQSSEQILHPEKYQGTPRDEPLPIAMVALTDTLGANWTYQDSDTLGEFDFSILLRENGVSDPDKAAGGWGGARYALYQNGEQALVILGTRWDSAADASEFAAALEQSLAKAKRAGDLWSDGDRFVGFVQRDDQVIYVAGTEQAATEQALAAATR